MFAEAGEETATAVPDDINMARRKATTLFLESLDDCKNRIVPPETRNNPLTLQFQELIDVKLAH